jgi:hypothetical protein
VCFVVGFIRCALLSRLMRCLSTCSQAGEATADVHTSAGASVLENIRALYGAAVARELLEVWCVFVCFVVWM